MKGTQARPLLISLFLLLLLAPGIAFLVVLINDKLVTFFTNELNVAENWNFYFGKFQKKYNFSGDDTIMLLHYLVDFYEFNKITSMSTQLIFIIFGLVLVCLGIVIIFIGAFVLNKKFKTTRQLVFALIFFWLITILGFGLLTIGQYQYQWTNEPLLDSLQKIQKPSDVQIIHNPYRFTSQLDFDAFLWRISKQTDTTSAKTFLRTFIFENFYQKLISLKDSANVWISDMGLWWFFLIQSVLVSLIVAFDYTSYASHLTKPNYLFKREKILLFGQSWFRKLWVSLKQPTIWNVLRIALFLITFFVLIEVILMVANLLNKNLSNLFDDLEKFPYGNNDVNNLIKVPDDEGLYARTFFLTHVLAVIYFHPKTPSISVLQFLPILGLSFLGIIWGVSIVLMKRISYLSRGSIILFYALFLPLLIAALFLFTYSQTNINSLIKIANDALDNLKMDRPDFYIEHYRSSLLGNDISNVLEWILFTVQVIFVIGFSGIASWFLWKIHKKENLKIKQEIPKFILGKKKKSRKLKKEPKGRP